MGLNKFIANYSAFNEWANSEIVRWLKGIDKELLYQKTPSSFSSIDYTLQHILRTQLYWLLFISEEDTSRLNWDVRENEIENILEELLIVSTKMKDKFSSFSEDELDTILNLDTPWAKNNLSRYEYIVHIVNHSSFHRGQIITMARCLGIKEGIVNTDYNRFNAREQASIPSENLE